jgi:hypothetical protein
MADVRASTNKSAASDDHWSLVRSPFEHAFPTRFTHHRAVPIHCQFRALFKDAENLQVVSVILGPATLVNEVCVGSFVA